jgi:dTMP kinase
VILPALEAGKWVVCDRFVDSSYAYQVKGLQQDGVLFDKLNEKIVGDNTPDITFFLDLPEAVYQHRLGARTNEVNRLDGQSPEFYRRAQAAYRERTSSPNHHVINADQPLDQVTFDINTGLTDYCRRVGRGGIVL